MKRDWKYTVLVIAVLTALGLTGCGQQTQQAEQPQLVKAIQVGSETAGTTAGTYSGTVKGRYQSNLSFQAGGRITARNVQLGSQVHAGDVLMTSTRKTWPRLSIRPRPRSTPLLLSSSWPSPI